MSKFVVYEKVAEAIYRIKPKSEMSDGMQTVVNLGSGLTAGFAAAIVSQPADTMLSKINKTKGAPGEGTTSRLIKIAKELGLKGSFSGLGARLFMVGTLTAGQFAIYGDVSSLLQYPQHRRQHQILMNWTGQEGPERDRRCGNWQISDASAKIWLV
jgi:solute carrier family 25 (mitochondrial phosphate transporter), member 3